MSANTSPFILAQIARQAESGDPMARHSISVVLASADDWACPECEAFATALDAKSIAFLRREFGPLIDRHVHLAVLLRQTETVCAELTPQNLRRWDKSAGRV